MATADQKKNGQIIYGNNIGQQVQLLDQEDSAIAPYRNKSDRPGVHRKKCRTTRILTALFIIILLILTAFLAYVLALWYHERTTRVCLTSSCIKIAATLLSSLQEFVDPCHDFYQFACGNWIKSHPIPDDRPGVSNFEHPTIEVENALKQILENQSHTKHSSIRTVRTFYRSCENDSLIQRSWRSAFNEALRRLGGWPVLDPAWQPANGKAASMSALSRLYALLTINYTQDSLFKFSVGADDKNSTINVFQLDQASLTLIVKDFYLLSEGFEERDAYLELMTELILLLGANSTTARKEMTAVLRFESELANITRDETRQDAEDNYVKVTLKQLHKAIENFDWILFMEYVYPGAKWSSNTEIVLYCLDFLVELNHLLAKHDERVVTNYLIWRWFYQEVLPQLADPYYMVHFKFHRILQTMKVPQLRWHSCVRQVNLHMSHATGALYVQSHFNPSAKHRAAEMIKMIKDAFHESVAENQWLSKATKLVASEKIDAMVMKTGYPDFVLNLTKVDDFYKKFVYFENDFFRTKFLFQYLNNRIHYARIYEPVDRNRWSSGSAVVNAFYSPNTNEIMFPAGILQPVFYSEDYPWSMNFGGIGVVIGHEMTHGFDDKGRQYDKEGNLREWWDNETIQMFEEKASCIERQYSRYEVEQVKLKVNGKNTKGENIADNGGLKQAFKAYLKWSESHDPEPSLPGLKYTHKQLFFINYAQIWCGSMNDKEFIRKMKSSVHSPGPIRVKGPLQNSYEFAEAFSCPTNSQMNPESSKKCHVW